jgi:probable rRNA maturation factor
MPLRTPPSEPRVEVIVDEALDAAVPVALMARAAEAALAAERSAGTDHVTVFITVDETLRDLNGRFNDLDEVTDVLSFNETAGWKDGRPPDAPASFPAEGHGRLGDVVISLPQAERQARAAGNPADSELAMLTVHGVLHLLGYDHARPDEERVMSGKTERILATVLSAGDQMEHSDQRTVKGRDRLRAGREGTRRLAAGRKPGQRAPGLRARERAL